MHTYEPEYSAKYDRVYRFTSELENYQSMLASISICWLVSVYIGFYPTALYIISAIVDRIHRLDISLSWIYILSI